MNPTGHIIETSCASFCNIISAKGRTNIWGLIITTTTSIGQWGNF